MDIILIKHTKYASSNMYGYIITSISNINVNFLSVKNDFYHT